MIREYYLCCWLQKRFSAHKAKLAISGKLLHSSGGSLMSAENQELIDFAADLMELA